MPSTSDSSKLRGRARSVRLICGMLVLLASTLLGLSPAAAQAFTLTLQPNTIPSGTANTAYSQLITAVGGNAPYTFAVTSGALPAGLSLASGGTLSGTPTTPNSYSFTITATDIDGNTGFRPYTFSIGTQGGLTLNPATLPNGSLGIAYNQTVTASGGSGGYVYSISAGSLPPGLSINPGTGAITGTPTAGGAFNFTVFARDSNGNTGTRAYTVNIGTASLTVNPATLPNGTQSVAYSQTVSASGGTGPYTFAVIAGALPAGLSLNGGTGAISGTPTTGGPFSFTIRATDSVANTGTRAYTVNIGTASLTVNPASLPNGTRGTGYSQTVTASGGTAPYSFAVSAGTLPTGLSLSSGGVLSGTPSAAGSFTFTVQATDTSFNTGTRAYTVTINLAALTINPAGLPNGTQGSAYSQTVIASGGTAPYTYALVAGALPPGLSLNSATGVIGGTPTLGGAYNFTVQATDSTPNTGVRAYTVNVGTNSLTVNPASLPAGTQGVAYNQTVSASGGIGPYTFALTAGALPTGLSLNAATGAISGTPSAGGAYNFTIQATDSIGDTGSRAYAVNIGTNSLTLNPATLPPAPQGSPYSQTVIASGGVAPYIYTVISGALPPGLALNPNTGAITGIPTTVGSFGFTIQARDINGNIGSRAYVVGTARLNPALDPDVRGLVDSQVSAARRFGYAQLSNVMQHLEGLHDDFDPCAYNFAMGLSLRDPSQPEIYPGMQNGGPPFFAGAGQRAPNPMACDKNPWWGPHIAIWAGGSIEYGSSSVSGPISNSRFSTAGVTSGVDVRVQDNIIVGGAVGYGSDRTEIGTATTRSDGRNISGLLYASYRPLPYWFVDAAAGYGYLDFDNRRSVAIDGSTVYGSRTGATWFGSLSLGTEFRQAAWKIAPYIRADYVAADLKQYAEQGLTNQALTFGAVGFSSSSAALGVRGFYDIPMRWGVLSPNVRLEYRLAMDGGYSQSLFYTDLGSSLSYAIDQSAASRNLVTVALGLRARTAEGMALDLEVGSTAAPGSIGSAQNRSLRAAARIGF